MFYTPVAVIIGFILDFIFGDPHWLYHPIRFIGTLIDKTEKCIRKICPKNPKGLIMGGLSLVIIVLFISTIIPIIILSLLYYISPILGLIAESIMCYQILAAKSLKTESMKVYHSFQQNDLEGARQAVSMIVGRDTKVLDKEGIIKATVETVAENTSDGVIAPLIYLVIGGPILGFFYKAVNTMDSMIGYKNEKYLYFGRCAAKLDDFLNYLPSRISAFFLILVCPFLSLDLKHAYKIYRRDNRNHSSPNSAQTEAACAGALGIRLGGDAVYFGQVYKKPYIGEETRKIENEDIKRANRLMYGGSILGLLFLVGVRLLFTLLFI